MFSYLAAALLFYASSILPVTAQNDTLGLSSGFLTFAVGNLTLSLVNASQTVYSLNDTTSSFDFSPSDFMYLRAADGNYHLGDLYFRARIAGSGSNWTVGDTSVARFPVISLMTEPDVLAAANLSPTLSENATALLNITRRWVNQNGTLQMLFTVQNAASASVEIGALGAPLEFNNIFTNRTAAQTNDLCSLFDPYVGQDAGYVQVTPLLGTLAPLVVTPVGFSPLEGWRFLPEDTTTFLEYQSQTFEALYEWSFHTLAYSEDEWANSDPWNDPSSVTLEPGQSRTYGLQFNLAPSIRAIENTLTSIGRPIAVGVPGYVLPVDAPAKLFLKYSSAVQNITSTPIDALTWETNADGTEAGWTGYTISSTSWGRARLNIEYDDGTLQTVHYYVTKSAIEAIGDLGTFLTTEQWFDDPEDPFHRSPSIISYDGQVNAYVKNDPRAWIPGLSDEGGAGSWLAAAIKQYVQPTTSEVEKLEIFVNQTLWGSVQNYNYTVKHSVFFYQPALVLNYDYPPDIDWTNWWSWDEAAAYDTTRAYDYVHVANAYWAMYRVARNYPSLVTVHDWQWYLGQAVSTIKSVTSGGNANEGDGWMGETVFRVILDDLIREGWTTNACLVETRMQQRQATWATERFPFGSEMAWDSTGQEGVYAWSVYFNDSTTAVNALNSILAYQPTIPHWGYNGNARRYWDNVYAGKLMRIERQIHHYGSGLNALPLLEQFMMTPNDTYLLRTGFGGISGPTTNIAENGFAAASFHSFEDTLQWDGYSGDYGPNFVGLSIGTTMFLVNMEDFGWQAFGGVVIRTSPSVQVDVLDAVRRRVFIASLGQLLTLDAGVFESIELNEKTHRVILFIAAAPSGQTAAAAAPQGRLLATQTVIMAGVESLKPETTLDEEGGAWSIPFANGTATVVLQY